MVLSRWWPDLRDESDMDANQLYQTCSGVSQLQKVTLRGIEFSEDVAIIFELPGLDIDYMEFWMDDKITCININSNNYQGVVLHHNQCS